MLSGEVPCSIHFDTISSDNVVQGHFPLEKSVVKCYTPHRICGVMFSVLALNAVDCGFEPRSGQANEYKSSICCFSDKLTAVRSNSKDCLALEQDHV